LFLILIRIPAPCDPVVTVEKPSYENILIPVMLFALCPFANNIISLRQEMTEGVARSALLMQVLPRQQPGIKSGDSVLFKRGDVFLGKLYISRSGNSGSSSFTAPMAPAFYPVIHGFCPADNLDFDGKQQI